MSNKTKEQVKTFTQVIHDLEEWTVNFGWQHFDWDKNVIIDEPSKTVTVTLYTCNHVYIISASPTYLGCIVQTRKPRPGENHIRGNDLKDGEFSYEMWVTILTDILSYEMLLPVAKMEYLTDTK